MRNINSENTYEVDLSKYNGTEVTALVEYGNTYEVETYDGSEYTVFKDELIVKNVEE
ncbi:hypothetical protein [Clostridium taeniosporum]|uniref:hypothetical protein n=1 Tax=Clostridium taeniosporum TaxID=394958 RepID=UPI001314E08C|nr:hypothetical protein [Clostridium taeniosporum]